MKIIRINEELHKKLKEHADIDKRTINAEVETILELYFSDADGKQMSKEAVAVKEAVVEELGVIVSEEDPYEWPRGPQDALKDIRTLEAERDEAIAICQDPEVAESLRTDYGARIQLLWNEYHTVNGEDDVV